MARFGVILIVSAVFPFAAALAETGGDAEATPAAPVEVATPSEPTLPSNAPEPVPAAPPAAAPTVALPTPAEAAPVPPPAAAAIAAPLTTAPALAAAAPRASPATRSPKRRVKAKIFKGRAATAVTLVNGREIVARKITVLVHGEPLAHIGPLGPKAQATLNLPKITGCRVTVAATFDGGSVSDGGAIDVCRAKLVRLTD